MRKVRFFRQAAGILVVLLFFFSYLTGQAADFDFQPPAGFELIKSGHGVAFYKKNYAQGSPDFVQIADLDLGAQVVVLHGSISSQASGQGVYGGDNARFNRLSIKQFWNQLSEAAAIPFCVSNGQFFRLADSPTPLPFPLKKDGQIVTDGYGIKEFPDQKLILEIWPDHLDIRGLTQETLYHSTAPNIVAGLTEDAEKASKKTVGRTFVGIDDRNNDHIFETLLIFNTRTARPKAAADVLKSFGAKKVMMLDGGGSTQLICQDQTFIDTERLIPQALGIGEGNLPEFAASLKSPLTPQVIGDSGGESIKLEIRNRGTHTWRPNETQVIVEVDGTRSTINLPSEIPTGDQLSVDWSVPAVKNFGIRKASVSLTDKGEKIPIETSGFDLAILPEQLAGRSTELQTLLEEWSNQPEGYLTSQVDQWIEQESRSSSQGTGGGGSQTRSYAPSSPGLYLSAGVSVNDIIWIPLLMIPMAALMLAAVRRVQQAQE